jgi:hypothetical protein
MLSHSPAIGPAIPRRARRVASAPSPTRAVAASGCVVARVAARRRREPWSGWREHRIGRGDIAGAWTLAALFLAALVAASL